MKFALLGDDDEAIALARAALDRSAPGGPHELAWCAEIANLDRLAAALPDARRLLRADWEAAAGAADVVIVAVGSDVDRRMEQLRLLAQSGIATCITRPTALGPIGAYELDMIRAESEAPLVPWLPDRRHPAIERLVSWLEAQDEERGQGIGDGGQPDVCPIGRIEQIVIERGVANSRPDTVRDALARDVDLCRALAGDVVKLSAVGAAAEQPGTPRDFAGLNVHLTTDSGWSFRWAVDRDLAAGAGRITLFCEMGRAVLSMPGEIWSLAVVPAALPARLDGPEASEEWFDAWRPAEVVLEQIVAITTGRATKPGWLDAARAADVADMVEVSLRRGRTVDIYNETYSEQGTFKGVMGMAGCGLLMLSFVVLLIGTIGQKAARLAGFPRVAAVLGQWHYGLLAVLVLFLALQLLRFIAKRPEGEADCGEL